MGTAHAGHDQCAHCFFKYIKPALAAERSEVKRRKAIKRNRLSPENRALINDLGLKESLLTPQSTTPPKTIGRAISEVLVDRELDRGVASGRDRQQVIDGLSLRLLAESVDIPLDRPSSLEPKDAPAVPATAPTAPIVSPGPRRGKGGLNKHPITDDQRVEIADAFAAGIPIAEIQQAYDIGAATLYTIVKKAGLPLRGRSGPKPQPKPQTAPSAPERKEPQMPTSPNTPLPSQPVPAAPSSNGTVFGLTEWVVTYVVKRTETQVVAAHGFSEAAELFVAQSADADVEVVGVMKKL
jgi:hypothetical protein